MAASQNISGSGRPKRARLAQQAFNEADQTATMLVTRARDRMSGAGAADKVSSLGSRSGGGLPTLATPTHAAFDAMMQSPAPDLGAALRLMRANILPMLLGMTLALMLGLAYLVVTKPSFNATASLFIDPRSRKVVSDEVMQAGIGTDVALFESQVAIVSSDATLRRVVDAENLTLNPLFVPDESARSLFGGLRDKVVGARIETDVTTRALISLARALRVRRAQNTYVVQVEVTTPDPVLSARLANAIAGAYLEDQAFAKSEAARKANALIDGRLGELKEQVRVTELKVDEFRRENKLVTSEGGLLNEQQLTRLNSERASIQVTLATARARLSDLEAIQRRGAAVDSLPEALASPTIQRLREQLSQVTRREAALGSQLQARHPVLVDARAQTVAVRAQIQAELQRIAEAVRSDVQVGSNRESEIQSTLKRLQDEVQTTTTSQIRLREIEREAEASREIYRAYLTRAKETSEQQNLTVADARIITPAAVPARPVAPNPVLVLAASALAGLGLGLGRAFINSALGSIALPATTVRSTNGGPGSGTGVPLSDGSGQASFRGSTLARERRQRSRRLDMGGDALRTAAAGGTHRASTPQRTKGDGIQVEPISQPVPILATVPRVYHRAATSPALQRVETAADADSFAMADVLGALADGTQPADKAFQSAAMAIVERLRDLARSGEPMVALFAAADRQSGVSAAALGAAYAAALAGHRVLLVDAASATAELSMVFAADLAQNHPCVLDNKAHLAEITWFDSRSGLGLLPIALADLRRMTPTQRRRFGIGLTKLARDYDLVVIDGGSLDQDQAVAALTSIATIVVPVVPAGVDVQVASGRVLGALGTGIDQMPGAIITPAVVASAGIGSAAND